MKQKLAELVTQSLLTLKENGTLAIDELPPVQIERTRDKQHGDFACNIAMHLAKPLKANPREIATKITDALPSSEYL